MENASESQVSDLQRLKDINDGKINDNEVIERRIKPASEIMELVQFIQSKNIRYNNLTGEYEIEGRPMIDKDYNDIYIDCKQENLKVSKDQVYLIIDSNHTRKYDPIQDFIKKYENPKVKGYIHKLCSSVQFENGFEDDNFDPHFFEDFFTKWYVNLIALCCEPKATDNPLFLCLLSEKQNIGKTEFFRRLLPEELKKYYVEHPIAKHKDFYNLMSQNIIIMDDELDGKSKQDITLIKSLTSFQSIKVRLAYGRKPTDLRRRSSFCGTGNRLEILNDPTGNRRIIPIEANNIDHEQYNSVDKNLLFVEAYNLYKSGYNYRLEKNDIDRLNKCTEAYKEVEPEKEIIQSLFLSGDGDFSDKFCTNTELFSAMRRYSGIPHLSQKKIGSTLKKLKFNQVRKKVKGTTQRGYYIKGDSLVFKKGFIDSN